LSSAKIFFLQKKTNCLPTNSILCDQPKTNSFYPMTESTQESGGPPDVPAAVNGVAALKNDDSDSDSKDGDSSTTNYGYGDDDSDNEDYFPVYGYGRNTKSGDDDNDGGEDDDADKGDDSVRETRCW
jgi:hypothetical protein